MKKYMILLLVLFLYGCNKETSKLNPILSEQSEDDIITQLNLKELQKKIKSKDSFILLITQSTCSYCDDLKQKVEPYIKENPDLPIYETKIDMLGSKKLDIDKNITRLNEIVDKYEGRVPEVFYYKEGVMAKKHKGTMSNVAIENFLIDCKFIEGEKKKEEKESFKLKKSKFYKKVDFPKVEKALKEKESFYLYIAENDRYNVMFSDTLASLIEKRSLQVSVLNLNEQLKPTAEEDFEIVNNATVYVQKTLSEYQYSPTIFHIKNGEIADTLVDNASRKELFKWFDKQE